MRSDSSNIGNLSESQDNVFGYELQQLLSADWRDASIISGSELQAIIQREDCLMRCCSSTKKVIKSDSKRFLAIAGLHEDKLSM